MPINCKQPNVYQYGESWTTEANEYHTLCAAYRTTSLNTVSRNVIEIAAAPTDSHGGDHTAQFVAASQGRGGQLPLHFCLLQLNRYEQHFLIWTVFLIRSSQNI